MVTIDLTRSQMLHLKQEYLDRRLQETEGRGVSWKELAEADSIVSDQEVLKAYQCFSFSPDDFWE